MTAVSVNGVPVAADEVGVRTVSHEGASVVCTVVAADDLDVARWKDSVAGSDTSLAIDGFADDPVDCSPDQETPAQHDEWSAQAIEEVNGVAEPAAILRSLSPHRPLQTLLEIQLPK